jgi:predicted ATPase
MSSGGVGALERGERRMPLRDTIERLASALALDDEQRRALEASTYASSARLAGGSIASGPWPQKATARVPFAVTSFVGRNAELDDVVAILRSHRLVTLTGAGGIGKTRTALQAATRLECDLGVSFVALAPISDPEFVVPAMASALGIQHLPDRPLLDTIIAALKNRGRYLLVLDNCEQVVTEAGRVAYALLANAPQLRILATSREPLKAAAEQTYRLPPLADSEAVALFSERARAADHRFALTTKNESLIAGICKQVDGLPLAIELAAARVSVLSLRAIAGALESRLGFLSAGERTVETRQRTLRATIDWSYDLLAGAEQRVFERLSIFAGGCTLEAAMSVSASEDVASDEVLDVIASLVDKSLLAADLSADEPRYHLFESFRHYASEKLAARGERWAVAHRHAETCLELAEHFWREYAVDHSVSMRGRARQDTNNWHASLQWTLRDRGNIALGQRLACVAPLGAFDKRRWIRRALQLVDAATPMSLVGQLRYEEAVVASVFFERETQLASSELAICHYREAADLVGVVRAQGVAGHALECLGRTVEATKMLQGALAAARTLNDRFLVAHILRCLGQAASTSGDSTTARRSIEEALAIYNELNAQVEIPSTLEDFGEIEFCSGNPARALQHTREMLRIVQEHDQEPLSHAHALSAMSLYLIWLNRFDEATRCAREALGLSLKHGLQFLAAWNLQHFATIAALRSDVEENLEPNPRSHAARLLGFVDAKLSLLGSTRNHTHRLEYERVISVLDAALGKTSVAKLMAEGTAMSEDEALEEALALSSA